MSGIATTAWTELRWWLNRLHLGTVELLRHHPGHAVVFLALILVLGREWPWLALPVAAVAVGLAWWAHGRPISFARFISGPLRGRRARRLVKRTWFDLCVACELAPDHRTRPRVRARWPRVQLVARPALGQTVDDFQTKAEALRIGLRASQIRVEPAGVSNVSVLLTFGDELAMPFEAKVPGESDWWVTRVPMGRRADGRSWVLPLGPQTLVAGSSGSGKGSLFWSFAFGLAPAVHEGYVQLHGIDLKGGMEILMGESLFTTRATNAREAVALLELLVEWMQLRSASYAGRVRAHTATIEEPLHVVMVDELAALTAYSHDRELQRRGEAALNLLCSQGRAPGFMVFACLQDPRKEVIPSRGLFTQMIGLRLKDLSETTMVLGEQAAQTGAHCHRITRDMPGTGYVIPEEGGQPIRVRAGFASDEVIRTVARRFQTPTRVPLVLDEDRPNPARSRTSRVDRGRGRAS